MTRRVAAAFVLLLVFFGVATVARAQEASITGTITDSTGAVLPGVTITATNEASGNTFVAIADARGGYVLPVRVGSYKITVELAGFGTVTKTGVALLVGQESLVNLQMSLQGVQESVTVTGDAPLVDTTQSKVGGNVDPRQVAELPLNGRDWRNLTMLVPGARQNAIGQGEPVDRGKGAFQVNVDGQQVTATQNYGSTDGSIAARFSRDAIAEFQVITTRFDASQGRSAGVQINAITKSGTNRSGGSLGGYFRSDKFNAADFIQHRVLPYSDQQISGTYGGPIVKDRVHYFANWEFERTPQDFVANSPYPKFNIDLIGTQKQNTAGVRTDFQLQPQTHFNVRWNLWRNRIPYSSRYAPSATLDASRAARARQGTDQVFGALTKTFGARGVNELKGGYNRISSTLEPYAKNPNSLDTWMPGRGSPLYSFGALYAIGTGTNMPQFDIEHKTQFADVYSMTFDGLGRHAMRMGGDFIYWNNHLYFCNACNGNLRMSAPPDAATLQALFPVWNDATTWNIAPLSPLATTWIQGFGNMTVISKRPIFSAYTQDDWSVTPKLTFNLGLRWDLFHNCCANDVVLSPWLNGQRSDQKDQIQPRVGFVWSLTPRTVVRGGAGKYYADISNQVDHWARAYSQQASVTISNDGRPDFASNPWNGAPPTYEQALARTCPVNRQPGCVQASLTAGIVNPNFQVPYSYQSSIGFERQLGETMSVEADFAHAATRHEDMFGQFRNINLAYNPATGANYPVTDRSRLPYQDFGVVNMDFSEGWSDLNSLAMAFSKRWSQRWQAAATYTLSWLKDGHPGPLTSDLQPAASFPLATDIGAEYGLAITDQRHRVAFNGIFDAGLGFQLSGSYLYGSGQRFGSTWGTDLRNDGGTDARLRPDGTIVPRNNVVGLPIHRIDVRLLRRFRFGDRLTADGMVEVFNVTNHPNYGMYVTAERSSLYGQPTAYPDNAAYYARQVQLGFRLAF